MFTYFSSLIENLFSTDYYKKNKLVMNKNLWVANELEKWKLDMYSTNCALANIPNSQIMKKREELKKEYDKKFNF